MKKFYTEEQINRIFENESPEWEIEIFDTVRNKVAEIIAEVVDAKYFTHEPKPNKQQVMAIVKEAAMAAVEDMF